MLKPDTKVDRNILTENLAQVLSQRLKRIGGAARGADQHK